MNLAHHSLQFVCKLLMAAIASAALLPGLVYSKAPPGATSTLLLVQVALLACPKFDKEAAHVSALNTERRYGSGAWACFAIRDE